MRFDLDGESQLFLDTTRRFIRQSCDLSAVRALADAGGGFERAWWLSAAALGWTSLLVPEEHGGTRSVAKGLVDLAIVAEAMGERVSPGPLLPTSVVAAAVAASGTDAQQRAVLPGIVSGELVPAWCHTGAVTVQATPTAEGLQLDGVVEPVEAADQADILLVTAQAGGQPIQVLVPRSAPGVDVERLDSLDLVRHFAAVHLAGVEVPADAVLGDRGATAGALDRQLAIALVLQSAECTGAAVKVLTTTVEYAFDRSSFGRPLASYQALKHRFADMRLWADCCQATTDAAAEAVEAGAADALPLARIAKAYVGEHAPEIIQDCIQLHGSIGVTWEHDLHLYLRRVTVDRALFGAPAEQRTAIGLALMADAGGHRG